MKKTIDNLSVTAKIALICLFPLAAMLVFAVLELMALRGDAARAERVARLVDVAPAISKTIHELQLERGVSSGFVSSAFGAFEQEMNDARTAADDAIAEMSRKIEEDGYVLGLPDFAAPYAKALKSLNGLDGMRRRVDARETTAKDLAIFYTGAIVELLHAVESTAAHAEDPEISRRLVGFGAFLEGKEAAGKERAVGLNGFGERSFGKEGHNEFVRLAGAQDLSLYEFGLYASAPVRELLGRTLQGTAEAEVRRLRDLAYGEPFGGSIQSATAIDWFKASSARIDQLHAVENAALEALHADAAAMSEEAENALFALLAITAALAFSCGLVALVIARSLRNGALTLTQTMTTLAEGDTSVDVPGQTRRDEIGAMSRAVEVFKQNALEKMRLEAEQAEAEQRAEAERRQAMMDLADQFETAVGNIVQTVSGAATELEAAAQTLTSAVHETNDRSATVASASEQASMNVQTVATAAEEMSASIREIGRQASESSSRADSAEREADDTAATVQQLSETARRIGDVIALIQEIAEQTNLLALNATIEAARAGEAGKGFAVVASEVKSLATQTAKATTDIAEQIQAIQNATGTSVSAIQRVTGAVKELNGIAATIASAVEEQTAATQEIAHNVQQAAVGTQDVSTNIADVSQAATESSTAAAQVLSSAGELSRQAANLNAEMNSFLQRVRAA